MLLPFTEQQKTHLSILADIDNGLSVEAVAPVHDMLHMGILDNSVQGHEFFVTHIGKRYHEALKTRYVNETAYWGDGLEFLYLLAGSVRHAVPHIVQMLCMLYKHETGRYLDALRATNNGYAHAVVLAYETGDLTWVDPSLPVEKEVNGKPVKQVSAQLSPLVIPAWDLIQSHLKENELRMWERGARGNDALVIETALILAASLLTKYQGEPQHEQEND